MVGGKIFNETPGLWQRVGADASAADAEQAVLLASLLVGESHA
jgi:methanogenic corrinoid protein MtbC1